MANEKLIALSEVKKKLTAIRQYFSGPPSTEQDKLARAVAKMCLEEVKKIKPADAVEVVHGRWILQEDGYHCSNCDIQAIYTGVKLNYCPNCGADMRGAEDG